MTSLAVLPLAVLALGPGSPSCTAARGAPAVFFATGGPPVHDPDSLLQHPSGARRLAEAGVEGGPELGALLAALGAARCGIARLPDGRTGIQCALAPLVVLPLRRGKRARVPGVALHAARVRDTLLVPRSGFAVHVTAGSR